MPECLKEWINGLTYAELYEVLRFFREVEDAGQCVQEQCEAILSHPNNRHDVLTVLLDEENKDEIG